ncbi:MAG: hypothetical protein DRG59_10435 [Deltaproteobacteria bacterium]|nr:MAG: hypothetical protein DRG83_14115 [Deltaproteobacteria bacterium]RLB04350.1 MAG: hypothetical protein DRG59_10435 [Deltaproteobacteria bacterium]HEC31977.1 hypothetical protein [Deltaproteobacteria bacterium]
MKWKKLGLALVQMFLGAGLVLILALSVTVLGKDSTNKTFPGWTTLSPPENITSLAIDGSTLWIGSKEGIFKVDLESNNISPVEVTGVSSGFVKDLLCDAGNIWVLYEYDLVRISKEDGEVSFWEIEKILPGEPKTLALDGNKKLWIGSEKGLIVFDGKTFEPISIPEKFKFRSVDVLFADSKNRIWVGSSDPMNQYLLRYEQSSWHSYSVSDGILHGSINDIIEDSDGNVIVAVGYGSVGGVVCFKDNKWESVLPDSVEIKGKVRSVFKDKEGRLLLGSEYDGLGVFSKGILQYYTVKEGLAGNEVRKILQDFSGAYWVATNQGLTRVESGKI